MAHIIILGAGLGGVPMAYEMKDLAGPDDQVTIVSDKDYYHFVPSNPWVAVDWRKRSDITVPLGPPMAKKGVELIVSAAKRVHPETNELELADGTRPSYDHLVIATRSQTGVR